MADNTRSQQELKKIEDGIMGKVQKMILDSTKHLKKVMEENKKIIENHADEKEERLFNRMKAYFEKGKEKEIGYSETSLGPEGGDKNYIDLNSGSNAGPQY